MKKLSILGTDSAILALMPALLASKLDIMIEDMTGPDVHVQAAPVVEEPKPAKPKAIPHSRRPSNYKTRRGPQGQTLRELVLTHIENAPNKRATIETLRNIADANGYARHSISTSISDLREAKKIRTEYIDGTLYYILGPGSGGAGFKHPEGLSARQWIVFQLQSGPTTRDALREGLVNQGWSRNTLEPLLSKLNLAGEIAYDYTANTVFLTSKESPTNEQPAE